MIDRHVTHLLTRYLHGQLRPAQQARVANHVRRCARCRAALAREERLAASLRRDLPALGQPRPEQLAGVWAGVLSELGAPQSRPAGMRFARWLPGMSMALGLLVLLAVALPLMAGGDLRVEAAPMQPRPVNTASPTPGATDTLVAALVLPQATIALALPGEEMEAGATPAPVPGIVVSPGARGSAGAR